MTLAETKMTKVLSIRCRLPRTIDMVALWSKIGCIPTCHLRANKTGYEVTFRGDMHAGEVVISHVIGTTQKEHVSCHMEIACAYE